MFAALQCAACIEEPVVTLGGVLDAGASDDDALIDEAERERVFRDLAERECREAEPVCGVDGVTYRNYCHAVANGAQINGLGPCAEPQQQQ
jgi:hypothetical protein